MKLGYFAQEGDTVLDRIDYPLFRAMAAKVKEIDVTPDEFLLVMRYAVNCDLYWQTPAGDNIVLGIKINIV